MAESTTNTETVKTSSDGTVKITVERFEELKEAAARPQTVVYNRVEKTPAMQANDNIMHGSLLMGGGGSMFVIGVIQLVAGLKQRKAL